MALVLRLAAQGLRSTCEAAYSGCASYATLALCSSSKALQCTAVLTSTNLPEPTAALQAAQHSLAAMHSSGHMRLLSAAVQQLLHAQPSSSARGITSSASQSSQCDCPTLGGPEPDLVVVEYDEEEVDRFIALADAIEEAFPNVVVEGNPSGPGRPGSFEVTAAGGSLVFSRLSSGGWPESGPVVDAIGAAAASCGIAPRSEAA